MHGSRIVLRRSLPSRTRRLSRSLSVAGLAALAATAAGQEAAVAEGAASAAPRPADLVQRVEREGIAVELRVTPLTGESAEDGVLREGDDVRVAFRIEDTTTGTPATTLEPAAWIHYAEEGLDVAQKVRSFLSANLASRAELDLNVFYVLAMNGDASISVVDPLFSYGGSRLLDMIRLRSPAEDWLLGPDQRRLYVTLPHSNRLAVVDTARWEVVAEVETGPRPVRVELQSDGKYLWVGCDGDNAGDPRSGVTVIDAASLEKVTHIPTGPGHHEIAFGQDDRRAFVTNAAAGTVSLIDVWRLDLVRQVEVGERPVDVDYNSLGQAAYVVSEGAGQVTVLDGESAEPVAVIEAEPGLGALSFAPGERFGFLCSTGADVVHIIDASTQRIVQTVDVGPEPDLVVFTETLAHVRSQDSELVLMIPLGEIGGEGEPVPIIDFSGGQVPFGRPVAAAEGIVPAPGGVSVLVANPGDGMIYYYREGMAAPMGSFKNYGSNPRAVLVVDRSLQEVEPGLYATEVNLSLAGKLDVPFFLDTPRILHCFSLEVLPSPGRLAEEADAGPPLSVEALLEGQELRSGGPQELRFRVTLRKTQEPVLGLRDFGVQAVNTRGWQRRAWAEEVGDGVYEASVTFPDAGAFFLCFQCPSAGLALNGLRPLPIAVADDEQSSGEPR